MEALPTLALIIPAHRVEGGWLEQIQQDLNEFKALVGASVSVEACLVLDGVSAEEVELCKDQLQKDWSVFSLSENLGKGASLRHGFKLMKASYYMFTDNDFPYTAESMRDMLEQLMESGGVVFGRRTSGYRARLPFKRRLLSDGLRLFNRYILRLRHPDTQCGLKAFDEQGKDLALSTSSSGFAFDLELALLCRNSKLSWTAIDIDERKGLRFSEMPVSLLRREWKAVRKFLFR